MRSGGLSSSGKEAYVLKVDEPRNLIGAHADLIQGAMGHGEKILDLIYSPMWESEKALLDLPTLPGTPWERKKDWLRLLAHPASHAIAVTERRFIISEDRHLPGISPVVQSIAFDRIISVELGSALILGWLVIQFVDQDRLSSTALFFPTSSGKEHFHQAVREYRKTFKPIEGHRRVPSRLWADVWPKSSLLQMERLRLLTREGEFLIFIIFSSEIWSARKRFWRRVPICTRAKGIFVATEFGFLHAVDEPPRRPGMPSFGVEVLCLPPEVLRSAVPGEEPYLDKTLPVLRLGAGRNSVTTYFHIPLNPGDQKSAVDLVEWLASKRSSTDLELLLLGDSYRLNK